MIESFNDLINHNIKEDKTAGGERMAGKHGEQAEASHLPQVEDQAGA